MKENNKILSLRLAPPGTGKRHLRWYFLGVGGIGMSALARYFISLVKVSGTTKRKYPVKAIIGRRGQYSLRR
ncbi:MAG: hypothetical protein WKI04_16785 [Ferruginibacter sp.]